LDADINNHSSAFANNFVAWFGTTSVFLQWHHIAIHTCSTIDKGLGPRLNLKGYTNLCFIYGLNATKELHFKEIVHMFNRNSPVLSVFSTPANNRVYKILRF
jgi:hypothetical protein